MSAAPNLFDYATSELSQDAFICWLLKWADAGCAEADSAMREAGLAFLRALFAKNDVAIGENVGVTVEKQDHAIDIVAVVTNNDTNEKDILAMEDKTYTDAHDKQLERYHDAIEEKYKDDRRTYIYLKTGDQASYEKLEPFHPFLRHDFLTVLDGYKNVGNLILKNDSEFLHNWEDSVEAYKTLPPKEWEWLRWVGFFKFLQEKMPEKNIGWDYVPLGDFMGAWWGDATWRGCPVYPQIEEQKLCIKLAVKVREDRSELRNELFDALRAADEKTFTRPGRFGCGEHMTAALIPNWIALKSDGSGSAALEATLQNLKDVEAELGRILSATDQE